MDINNNADNTATANVPDEKRYAMFAIKNLPVLFYCPREEFDKLPKALGVITLIDEPKNEWYMDGYAAEFGLPLVMWTVRQV